MILDDFKDGKVILRVTSDDLLERLLQWCDKNDMKWASGDCALEFVPRVNKEVFIYFRRNKLKFRTIDTESHTLVAKDFEFTYDDLVPGMIVETRGGELYLFIPGNRPFINLRARGSYMTRIFNRLTSGSGPHSDIVKVYKTDVLNEVLWGCSMSSLQLVWERDPEKEALRKKIESLRKELLEAEVAFEAM